MKRFPHHQIPHSQSNHDCNYYKHTGYQGKIHDAAGLPLKYFPGYFHDEVPVRLFDFLKGHYLFISFFITIYGCKNPAVHQTLFDFSDIFIACQKTFLVKISIKILPFLKAQRSFDIDDIISVLIHNAAGTLPVIGFNNQIFLHTVNGNFAEYTGKYNAFHFPWLYPYPIQQVFPLKLRYIGIYLIISDDKLVLPFFKLGYQILIFCNHIIAGIQPSVFSHIIQLLNIVGILFHMKTLQHITDTGIIIIQHSVVKRLQPAPVSFYVRSYYIQVVLRQLLRIVNHRLINFVIDLTVIPKTGACQKRGYTYTK